MVPGIKLFMNDFSIKRRIVKVSFFFAMYFFIFQKKNFSTYFLKLLVMLIYF